jgi:hypothetical protein
MSEEALVRRLEWFFRELGYIVAKEVPVGMRSIDLYCVAPNTGTTIAVEAKLRDWRRALRQARVYKLAADLTYIALPEPAITQACIDACSTEGIGAIAIPRRGRARLIHHAIPSHHQQRPLVYRALSVVGPRIGTACLYC